MTEDYLTDLEREHAKYRDHLWFAHGGGMEVGIGGLRVAIPSLIAEVRRLRATVDDQSAFWIALVAELRACLEIAMEWCPDEGGFSTARDCERCKRALEASR